MKKALKNLIKATMVLVIIGSSIISNAQLKISGLAFGDYAYKLHADSVKRGSTTYAGSRYPNGYNGFDIRRIYLGFDYDITSKFHAEAVLAHEIGDTLADANRAIYLKYANIRWKNIFKGTDLIIGQQRTPTFATPGGSEGVWNYRSIEKTLLDMRGVASSTDLGINLQGSYLDGKLGFDVMYGNNRGAKVIAFAYPALSSHRIYADVYGKLINKMLTIQLYYDNYNIIPKGQTAQATASTMKGFISFSHPMFTIGVEGYQASLGNSAKDASGNLVPAMPMGFSGFARVVILKDKDTSKASKGDILTVFGRFDSYDPDTKIMGDLVVKGSAPKESFITAGIDWAVAKNVHLIPNIWMDSFLAKTGTKYTTDRSDKDMVGRITFFWKF